MPPATPIAIIGLGYVGLPLAVEFAKVRPVIGFDINPARIAELEAGRDSTLEVEPEELRAVIDLAAGLRFTADPEALRACTCFIVTVPTPIDAHKRPDLTPLIKASETVGWVLKPGDIVIYESTVYPGCTEEDCVPILERESGLRYISTSVTRTHRPSSRNAEGVSGVHAALGDAPAAMGHITAEWIPDQVRDCLFEIWDKGGGRL